MFYFQEKLNGKIYLTKQGNLLYSAAPFRVYETEINKKDDYFED